VLIEGKGNQIIEEEKKIEEIPEIIRPKLRNKRKIPLKLTEEDKV
jgi:hypothetical protein